MAEGRGAEDAKRSRCVSFFSFFGRCAAGREPSFPDEKSSGAGGGRTSDENQDLGTNRANVVTNKGSTRNHVIAPSNPPPISSGPPHQPGRPALFLSLIHAYHQLLRRIHQNNQHRNSLSRSLHQYFSTKFVFRLYLQQLAFAQAKLGLRFFPR